MKKTRSVGLALISFCALRARADDFSLKHFGAGSITLHTALTYEGKGERLVATARNGSGAPIVQARICILSYALKEGCLFELWNTGVWAADAELSWSVTTGRRVPTLVHDATYLEFQGVTVPGAVGASAPQRLLSPSASPPLESSRLPVNPPAAPLRTGQRSISGQSVLLQDGTSVRTRLSKNLSSSVAREGDTVEFEVMDDIKAANVIVIARGTTAMGTVTDAVSKRSMGRAGHLDVTIDYVRSLAGEKIRLRGLQNAKAGGHVGAITGAMIATSVVFFPAAPLFLFLKGKDATIPRGHEVTVYVDGDVPVALASEATPEPVRIEASAARTVKTGKPMTNEDVLALKAAGFGDEFILTKVRTSEAGFVLDTLDLVKLKQAGVSEAVLGAMVQAAERQ